MQTCDHRAGLLALSLGVEKAGSRVIPAHRGHIRWLKGEKGGMGADAGSVGLAFSSGVRT